MHACFRVRSTLSINTEVQQEPIGFYYTHPSPLRVTDVSGEVSLPAFQIHIILQKQISSHQDCLRVVSNTLWMPILFPPGARSADKWFNDIEGPEALTMKITKTQPGFLPLFPRDNGSFCPCVWNSKKLKVFAFFAFLWLCLDIHIWRD